MNKDTELVFQFKDIDNLTSKKEINKNTQNELIIFKEFCQKHLFNTLNTFIDFDTWWFRSGIILKNNNTIDKDKKNKEKFTIQLSHLDKLEQNIKQNNNIKRLKEFIKYFNNNEQDQEILNNLWYSNKNIDENLLSNNIDQDDEIDILFINKDKYNNSYFFLVEIKDFSKSKLLISKYWECTNAKVKIQRKDLNLESYIFSLLNKDYTFIRINIFKWDNEEFKYQYYKFDSKESKDFFEYPKNNWIRMQEQDIEDIFLNTDNASLKDNDIYDYIRQFHSNNYLDNLLMNCQNKEYISNVLVSNVNFKSLNHISNNKDNKITIINGIPGSGKTVFAFLLFITEKNVLLILTNKANYEKYRNNQYIKKIEEVNNNKIIFYTSSKRFPWAKDYDCDFDQIQRNITNYQVILIDEFQNIENSLLENIANCCFNVNKEYKVFLFGDEKQNIYGKLNFENNESDHDKYNHLVENLKQIIIEKFNLAKLAKKDIEKELLKYLYESDDFKISNRFNLKDFNKINYISFGNKNYKN